MKKFVVIYHTPPEALDQTADPSPEEMEEGMKPWMAWAERCGEHLVDQVSSMLNNHPHLSWNKGCEIEVHEVMPLPGSN